jgi:hypothetical protein
MTDSVKKVIKIAIPTILFLWGSFCFLKSYGYCYESSIVWHEECLFESYEAKASNWPNGRGNPISKQQKAAWQEEYDNHMFHAKRCYEDAKNRVWCLPDVSWRERGKQAWIAAFSCVGVPTIQLKLLVAVSSMLMQYGLDCLDEWEYIEEKLNWSQYHLEQCERLAKLLHG